LQCVAAQYLLQCVAAQYLLQCVAAQYLLQCVAAQYLLQCVAAERISFAQYKIPPWYVSVLQLKSALLQLTARTATNLRTWALKRECCCNTLLQHTATSWRTSALQGECTSLQHTATHCNYLEYTLQICGVPQLWNANARCYNTLQHTLQHTLQIGCAPEFRKANAPRLNIFHGANRIHVTALVHFPLKSQLWSHFE